MHLWNNAPWDPGPVRPMSRGWIPLRAKPLGRYPLGRIVLGRNPLGINPPRDQYPACEISTVWTMLLWSILHGINAPRTNPPGIPWDKTLPNHFIHITRSKCKPTNYRLNHPKMKPCGIHYSGRSVPPEIEINAPWHQCPRYEYSWEQCP